MQGSQYARNNNNSNKNKRSRSSYRRMLLVEPLEDRQLLATFNLTDVPADGAVGSLRAAISTSNGNGEDDQINLAAGSYAITQSGINETANATGDFNFSEANQTITITGVDPDTTIIEGGFIDRVMRIDANVNIVLENVTLTQAAIDEDFHSEQFGAVILNRGNLTLNNVVISENLNRVDGGGIFTDTGSTLTLQGSVMTDNFGARGANLFARGATVNINQSQILNAVGTDGAGIYAVDSDVSIIESTIDSNLGGDAGSEIGVGGGIHITSSQGTFSLDLIRSTVSQNSATAAGGIHASGSGAVLIENSTISNNTANGNTQLVGDFGGLFAGNGATVEVRQSTIVRNSAANFIGGFGNTTGDSAAFFNTILAENDATNGQSQDGPTAGTINSLGNNLFGNTLGMNFTSAPGDISGSGATAVDPLLGDLENNGGPTRTHKPAVASPAVDTGLPTGAPGIDQLGIIRPQDGDSDLVAVVDIGAVEVPASLLVLQPEKDVTLQQDNIGNKANGSGTSVFVGTTADENISLLPGRRAAFKFDLVGLVNPGAVILDARLELTQTLTHFTSGDRQIDVHKLTADWGEGASNVGDDEDGTFAQTDDATWSYRFFDDNNRQWATPGGDFAAAVSATQTVIVPSPVTTPTKVEWSSPQLIQDILDWAANPATNYGWVLIGEEGFDNVFSSRRFASRENNIADNRPKLIIEFDNSAANDTVAPTVLNVQVNRDGIDANDLAKGTQPTSWVQQRSEIYTIDIEFNEPVVASGSDFTLTNLGLNANSDPDTNVALSNGQISTLGNIVSISFAAPFGTGDPNLLPDGLFELVIHDTLTDEAGLGLDGDNNGSAGGDYTHTANATNKFGKLGFNFNGDGGVSVFDFSTFSYWFGTPVNPLVPANGAPRYADVNNDGGVSVFDFNTFSRNFGTGVSYPVAFQSTPATAAIDFNGDGDVTELDFHQIVEAVNDAIGQVEVNIQLPMTPQDALRVANRLAKPLELNGGSDDSELEFVLDTIVADIADVWTA
ncbi:MAG: hypothetical protein ACI9G1_003481 [Pirellulaceae bacterium]|jgi:hypothetical protein